MNAHLESDAGRGPVNTTVRDVMTSEVVTVTPVTSIGRIAELMDAHAISGLPVVDEVRRVVGVITDHDLIIRNTKIDPPPFLPLLEGRIPLETPGHFERRVRHMVGSEARDMMSAEVHSIGPDEDVEALAELMIHKHLHLVPVVEGGRLVGVVTRADVIRWMTREGGPTAPRT